MKKKRRSKGSPRAVLEKKAMEIYNSGEMLSLKNNRYLTPSQSQKGKYFEVTFLDKWTCTCKYHINGQRECKHIIAVQNAVQVIKKLDPVDFTIKMPEPSCKTCGPDNCVHYETRKTKSGESVRYRCKTCGSRFTFRPGFIGLHYPTEMVTDAIERVVTGSSLGVTARALKKAQKRAKSCLKRSPCRSTIWRWSKKAAETLRGINKKIPIPTGSKWHVDEIHLKVKGRDRWLFGVLDSESRFVLAYDIADDKLGYDATELFRDAVDVAGKKPEVLISDDLVGFKTAFKKVMKCRKNSAVHIHSAAIRKRHGNNNKYERFNGSVKDRIKIVRGFCSKNPPLCELYVHYYNFMRPHQGLDDKTPSEYLGIRIDGDNHWETLLAYASVHCC